MGKGMKKILGLTAFTILIFSVLSFSSSVDADWPMFRNDITHSGISNITGNFSGVKCLWKYNADSWIISSPSVADIDNDGFPEIVFGSGDGKIHVLDHNGTERWNKSVGYAGYDVTSSPTIADINNDNKTEIIVTTWDKIYVFDNTGDEIWNYTTDVDISNWTAYPLTTPSIQSSPIVTDLNNDNISETIITSWNGDIYVLDHDGNLSWNRTFYTYISGSCGVSVRGGGEYRDSICSTPSAADLDNDASAEIIFQTMSGNLTVLHSDGTTFWYYPITWYEQVKPQFCQGWCSPLVYDINDDGKLEVVIGSSDAYLYALSWNGSLLWKFYANSIIESSPAVINNKIVFGSGDGNIYCVNSTGNLSWKYKTEGVVFSSPAVANINNDTKMEIIIGSSDGRLYCLDENGTKLFSYQTNGSVSSSPAVADIDGDGNAEIIFGSNDGYLYVLTDAELETDLRVGGIKYDGSLVQMDSIILSVKVYNNGTVDSNNAKVEFFDNNVSIGNETVDFVSVNGEENVDIEWIPSEKGVHEIKAEIPSLMNEINTSNNMASINLSVEERVIDLHPVSENMIYLGETSKKEGELIVIHAVVHNDGNGDAFNVNASVYVDDILIKILCFSSVPKNGYRDLSTYWTATPGLHTVKVVVEKNAYETNTSNNEASVNINVQKIMEATTPEHTIYEYWLALGILTAVIIYIVHSSKKKKY
jgi:hypothetical protein